MKKIFSIVMLALILISTLTIAFNIKPAKAGWTGTVYIRADGSIDPPDAPIITYDDVIYTLTDNIKSSGDGIIVERDNIVIDGAGHTLQGTGAQFSKGIDLSGPTGRTNVTVRNTQIINFWYGIFLYSYNPSSNYNIISGNNMTNNYDGIYLWNSLNNTISGNNMMANINDGICFVRSSNNAFFGNNIANNGVYGMSLVYSLNNTISGNTFIDNGLFLWDSYQNVAENNTVNGKSLVYLEGMSNYTVRDAGQVILVKCQNIRVEGLNLSRASIGVELLETNNSVISGNNLINNRIGIFLYSSNCNIISGNKIMNNLYGIYLENSSSNSVYHNNFINNTIQADSPNSVNVWDGGYPSGGNYWSNYTGVDADSDGIGDTPYTIDADNRDRHPLMALFTTFDAGIWNDAAYNIDMISNSTILDFHFNPEEGAFLRFNVTGDDGTLGFCRVTIPKDLLWIEEGQEWIIFVGDQQITDYTEIPDPNQRQTYLYFIYNHSTQTVIIQGTHVIPEFPSVTLPLFMLLSMMAVIFTKKKRKKEGVNFQNHFSNLTKHSNRARSFSVS